MFGKVATAYSTHFFNVTSSPTAVLRKHLAWLTNTPFVSYRSVFAAVICILLVSVIKCRTRHLRVYPGLHRVQAEVIERTDGTQRSMLVQKLEHDKAVAEQMGIDMGLDVELYPLPSSRMVVLVRAARLQPA